MQRFAFSLMYFLQYLHLTCRLTTLSLLIHSYVLAMKKRLSAMSTKRSSLSRKLP